MLINRKRSYRRGPTYRQTYVPHDQRQLNTQPAPIMNERTAQYYLQQLIGMGYINTNAYVVTIKHKNSDGQVMFDIQSDLSMGTGGTISSANMKILDIYGNPYSTPLISNDDILNRVGVKLYPIIANGGLGVYNATEQAANVYFCNVDDSQTVTSKTVNGQSYQYITDYPIMSSFTKALISAESENMFYHARVPNYPDSAYDVMYCSRDDFYLVCKELTVLVYPA